LNQQRGLPYTRLGSARPETHGLLQDEISTGLDSSTTFQIVRSLRDFVQLGSATAVIALLQPAPEVFDLFDDIMLLSEGAPSTVILSCPSLQFSC